MFWLKKIINRHKMYNYAFLNQWDKLSYYYDNNIYENILYMKEFNAFLKYAYKRNPDFFMNNLQSFIHLFDTKIHNIQSLNHPVNTRTMDKPNTTYDIHYFLIRKLSSVSTILQQQLISRSDFIEMIQFLIMFNRDIYPYHARHKINNHILFFQKMVKKNQNKHFYHREITVKLSYLFFQELRKKQEPLGSSQDIAEQTLRNIIPSFDKHTHDEKNTIVAESYFLLLDLLLNAFIQDSYNNNSKYNFSTNFNYNEQILINTLHRFHKICLFFFTFYEELDIFQNKNAYGKSIFDSFLPISHFIANFYKVKNDKVFMEQNHQQLLNFLNHIPYSVLKQNYHNHKKSFEIVSDKKDDIYFELMSKIEKVQIHDNIIEPFPALTIKKANRL